MQKQAVISGFAACVLVVSARYFAGWDGVVLVTGGMVSGWMLNYITPRPRASEPGPVAPAVPPAVPAPVNEAAERLQSLESKTSSLRHDLRGILSPAYLTAERLLDHADPLAKRAGEMMMQTVERASARLNETKNL